MRSLLPWPLKIVAKIVLSRLPISYATWRKLNMFAHGSMLNPDYAVGVFATHFDACTFARKAGGFKALEIGPGDSLLTGVVARAHGAATCLFVDEDRYAHAPLQAYLQLAR